MGYLEDGGKMGECLQDKCFWKKVENIPNV
jgi:hypothetical protein